MSILAIHVDAIVKDGISYDLDRWSAEVVEEAGGYIDIGGGGVTVGPLRERLARYVPSHDAIVVIGTEATRQRVHHAQRVAHVAGLAECMSVIVRDDWDSGALVRGLETLIREACFGSDAHIDLVVDGDIHFVADVERDALVHLAQPVAVHRADPVLGLIDAVLPAPEPQPL